MTVAAAVGRRIRVAREALRMTQGELAHQVDRTQTSVSYWESGERLIGLDDLLNVAHVLAIDPAELLPELPPRPDPVATARAAIEAHLKAMLPEHETDADQCFAFVQVMVAVDRYAEEVITRSRNA